MLRSIVALFLFICLTACGFKLRGELPLAPPLHNLYLQTADPYGELARNLKLYLKSSGVHLTDTANTASTVFVIQKEETSQQLLSVGGTQQTRQYNLILAVTFEITTPQGVVLVPSQLLSQSRTIPIQSNQILGGSNEANNLYSQMRQSIVYDIMSRIASQDVTKLVMKKP